MVRGTPQALRFVKPLHVSRMCRKVGETLTRIENLLPDIPAHLPPLHSLKSGMVQKISHILQRTWCHPSERKHVPTGNNQEGHTYVPGEDQLPEQATWTQSRPTQRNALILTFSILNRAQKCSDPWGLCLSSPALLSLPLCPQAKLHILKDRTGDRETRLARDRLSC